MDRGDRQERLEARGNALPADYQAAILLLEPGKGALRLESRHHLFDRSTTRFLRLPDTLGDLGPDAPLPELLTQRFRIIPFLRCDDLEPFAGSAPRATDPEGDAANGAALAASAKDRHEHQLVIDAMRSALEPLCDELTLDPEPQLSRTAAVWHLCTPISGRLRETSTTAIDLALALHPTPAVGGVPTQAATELIAELEGDRGFYAGAVGWCDAGGDGRWVVSIRCAQLSADRRTAVARAGGGIVAESDPDAEVAETTTKFATMLNALEVVK